MSQESSLPGHHFVEMDLGFPMAHELPGLGEAVLSCGCSLSRRVAPWARRGQPGRHRKVCPLPPGHLLWVSPCWGGECRGKRPRIQLGHGHSAGCGTAAKHSLLGGEREQRREDRAHGQLVRNMANRPTVSGPVPFTTVGSLPGSAQ